MILTRLGGGKTPMPPGEEVREFARHGTTMALFLSAARSRQLQEVADAGRFLLQDDAGEAALTREADHRVRFGQRGLELVAVALSHATGEHELGAGPLHVCQRERDIDRLLAGRLDERAGVDHDGVREPGGQAAHRLALDRVQAAAEGEDLRRRRPAQSATTPEKLVAAGPAIST